MSEDWGQSIIERMRQDANPLNWRMRSNTDRKTLEDSKTSTSSSRTSQTVGFRHSNGRGTAESPSDRGLEPDLESNDANPSRENYSSSNIQTASGKGQRDSAASPGSSDVQPSKPETQKAGVQDTTQNSRTYAGDSSRQREPAGSTHAQGAQLGRPESMDTDLEAPLLGGNERGDFDDDQKRTAGGPPGPDANSSSRQSSLLQSSANLANTVVGAGELKLRVFWLSL